MKQKYALITGPTGGVGANLIEELISRGTKVTAVCRPESQRIKTLYGRALLNVVKCPMSELPNLAKNMPPQDAFYHLAWGGTTGAARDDMTLQLQNVEDTLIAVRTAKMLGCQVFVGAGSQAEYGFPKGVLYSQTPCKPVTGYGAAKLSAGQMSRVLCTQMGIRHIWCRILSMYGPHDGSNTMVMSVTRTLLKGERPKCTAGEQLWDYIYAKDLARAFRLAAEYGRDGAIYCMGSGESRTLRAYIEAIRDAIDPKLPIGFGEIPYYPNQVMHMQADISDLSADTGYEPCYTFEEGIRETIEWVRENGMN